MPHCPTCGFEYREGLARCPDCGGELLPGPPLVAPARPAHDELVELCRLRDPVEAEVVRAVLQAAGIPSLVRTYGPITGELARVTDGLTTDRATVYVTRDRLEEARQVLASLQARPDQEGQAG